MFFEGIAHAMAPAQSGAEGGNPLMMILPWIIIFGIMYFLIIRPQQKKAKEHREMLGGVKKGDTVLTAGGIYGRVVSISDVVLTIDIGDEQKVRLNRNYIASVGEPGQAPEKKEAKEQK